MKRRIFLTLAAAAAGVFFNATAAQAADPVKIGFLVKQPEEPWFQDEWKFAEIAARQKGFTLVKIGAPSGEKVMSAIDNLAGLNRRLLLQHCHRAVASDEFDFGVGCRRSGGREGALKVSRDADGGLHMPKPLVVRRASFSSFSSSP